MREAIIQAKKAEKKKDVPVGAIVVSKNKIIARGHNRKERNKNSLNHAEIIAMNKACKKLNSKYLDDCQIYVTLEPCAMCAGAMINYRIEKLVFGAWDPKTGCCGSVYDLLGDCKFNHRIKVVGGVLEEECSLILKSFFQKKRKRKE